MDEAVSVVRWQCRFKRVPEDHEVRLDGFFNPHGPGNDVLEPGVQRRGVVIAHGFIFRHHGVKHGYQLDSTVANEVNGAVAHIGSDQ